MRKFVMVTPFVILASLVILIAWVNLAPNEDVSAGESTEEVSNELGAREYIKTAWDNWSNGGWADEDYEKNVTFISLKSISSKEMADLGVAKEFADLQRAAEVISGGLGELSVEEKQVYYDDFGDKLYKIHSAIN
ncbi:hypothetical protein [Planococcus shenhongbingii]|uniref:Uncharacterized protein n=1 Tax=Planococcus shenhongbingii TaxID=3058398 RepID=A0ABT8NEH0_9BACL|nr:hypothetical protein [Planococcus sp. N017]MDN7246285.1 hypothetical protein [Planococcus sp. N017]